MLFSSLIFLFGFLPVFLAAYYGSPHRWKNAVALVASLFFYAWGEPLFALVLVISSALDHGLAHRLEAVPAARTGRRKALLTLGIAYNLGVLLWCKYANFFVAQFNAASDWLHLDPITGWKAVALPIGVSFFTFHKISYLVDVYRGTARPTRNLADYILYIALFPQLVAGPIIRYHDVEEQLRAREHTIDKFLAGLWRFCLGLGQKLLLANPLGAVADKVFAVDPAGVPTGHAWLGIVCYTLQIYFDFAAYSAMALGLGRMIGFEFLENFNLPYTARTVTEFWRRWHMSLSGFMRDYLYIPLGGNRVGALRQAMNLWIVFLASGFWHGASWSFVVWGAWHGALLSLEKLIGVKRLQRLPAPVGWLWTIGLVMIGWVFFRADTLTHAVDFLGRLVAFDASPRAEKLPQLAELVPNRTAAMLAIAAIVSVIPESRWAKWGWLSEHPDSPRRARWRTAAGAALLLLAAAALANGSYNPFIYTRF